MPNRDLDPTEDNFREFVDGLFRAKRSGIDGMLHAAVGMAGESGEVLDIIKKSWVYDKPLDREKLLEEMGDVLHYMMQQCIKQRWTFGDLIQSNMVKLSKRYPNGFTKADAIARRDVRGPAGAEGQEGSAGAGPKRTPDSNWAV